MVGRGSDGVMYRTNKGVETFQLPPPSPINVLGTSLDLLGAPSRVTPHKSNYY
ncbi:hypothetical protein EV368DRAFT_89100 [Lentinula lateritia]|nr:hypothetical protein EV368DRAFT_89100 [Lentinula lateritia]